MRVTRAEVIKTASDMADRNGLHNVSLKAIAENLGIRTPSLYNHIGSLDELLREIAHSGMRTMNEKMIRAMYMEMGRKPSEAQIKKIMSSVMSQYK